MNDSIGIGGEQKTTASKTVLKKGTAEAPQNKPDRSKDKLKVLSLEAWMKSTMWGEHTQKEIEPIFNREGYYLMNGYCWFEVRGKAYEYDVESFIFRLKLLMHRPIRDIEYSMLSRLSMERYLPKELREMISMEEHRREKTRLRYGTWLGRRRLERKYCHPRI